MLLKNLHSISQKLDLTAFIENFHSYFSRQEPFFLQGDINVFKVFIDELDNINFTPPQNISNLDTELIHISKRGVLKLDSIFEFVKIIKYFLYLKNLNLDNFKHIPNWLSKIEIPQDLVEIANSFDTQGKLISGIYPKLDSINASISLQKIESKKVINRILQKEKLFSYFVDKQIHLVDTKECFLLKAGFDKILEGRILERSASGYFYVFPLALQNIYERLDKLQNEMEILIYAIEQEISSIFLKHLLFLKFINREFDKFDCMQARVVFAKENNYNFILPNKKNEIILSDFLHPALHNPIPSNINFTKQILIITGVNAGGKTMLLKSILSAAFLAKYLIPFKINPHKSRISYFKFIYSIINDPQNSNNDISTFAGRMLEFRNLLPMDNFLLGIDEIELGTDSNEASALYFAILEYLQNKHTKIVITTHHKQLASMMANNPKVELIAALYDEKSRMPTYSFLQGCIGKSYAFESALRYGIPVNIINKAKEVYGDNLENLNELIEKTSILQTKLNKKEQELESLIKSNQNKNEELSSLIAKQNEELRKKTLDLESTYSKALRELKEVLKRSDTREIHRFLNKQDRFFSSIPKPKIDKNIKFEVGGRVQSGKNSGVILSLKDNIALVELDCGIKLKINTSLLRPSAKIKDNQKINITKNSITCNVSLDLHGKRAEEAIELLDKYISNCLVAGYDEVIIYHGIGSGILSRVVKEFLSTHPKVKSFSDAPSKSGGFGAKIVRF
ncbi:endonuclease MutS2 [Helicobacter sp. 16-1353]|uniref:endonuclease MutS2 n=1 Tax=Helicobacter sp. 16-1353 TaxID=2004996 RepID=UPI000DCB44D7|nr:endonuclease MutS2 [Helicobacter sp. 16-1353]RAX52049.1 endonuclease MutS2 [Helicobacter sp. 16-1353]